MVRRVVQRQSTCKGNNSPFGGIISGPFRKRYKSGGRCNVDDSASPLLQHPSNGGGGNPEDAMHIDFHHALPFLIWSCVRESSPARAGNTSIVHNYVQAPPASDRSFDHALCV